MSVDFLHQTLDTDLLAVELHLLSILLRRVSHWPPVYLPGHLLNLSLKELGSVESRGSSVVEMAMPDERALGGRCVRNRRAGLALREKGLSLAETSVRNLVIILVKERNARLLLGSDCRGLGRRKWWSCWKLATELQIWVEPLLPRYMHIPLT